MLLDVVKGVVQSQIAATSYNVLLELFSLPLAFYQAGLLRWKEPTQLTC